MAAALQAEKGMCSSSSPPPQRDAEQAAESPRVWPPHGDSAPAAPVASSVVPPPPLPGDGARSGRHNLPPAGCLAGSEAAQLLPVDAVPLARGGIRFIAKTVWHGRYRARNAAYPLEQRVARLAEGRQRLSS